MKRDLAEAAPYRVEIDEESGYERILGPGIETKLGQCHGFEDQEVEWMNTAYAAGLAAHEAQEVVAYSCDACDWLNRAASPEKAQADHDELNEETHDPCRASVRALVER